MKKYPYLIAEIAQAHDGSLGTAHAYIDAVAKTGVSAIKFQMHIAEAESSEFEPFRVNFSYEDATRFDYWKRMEFSAWQWRGLKDHCDQVGLDFICSPFSLKAVDELEKLNVSCYKIGSGEVTNLLLLEKIAQTKRPVIISSGMSNYKELDQAVAVFKMNGTDITVLQCTTAYPTTPEQYGLNVMSELRSRYQVRVGFSDHSAQIHTGIAAIALGAEVLEFHVVFHNQSFGPDAAASLSLEQTSALVTSADAIYKSLHTPVDKTSNDSFGKLKSIFEKSLAINKDLPEGHILRFEDLESKKPKGYGIPANHYLNVIGKPINKSKKCWDFLTEDDI